jgi:hypothetical protein
MCSGCALGAAPGPRVPDGGGVLLGPNVGVPWRGQGQAGQHEDNHGGECSWRHGLLNYAFQLVYALVRCSGQDVQGVCFWGSAWAQGARWRRCAVGAACWCAVEGAGTGRAAGG